MSTATTENARPTADQIVARLAEIGESATEAVNLAAALRAEERVLIVDAFEAGARRVDIANATSYTIGQVTKFILVGRLDEDGEPVNPPLSAEERAEIREAKRIERKAVEALAKSKRTADRLEAAAAKAQAQAQARADKAAAAAAKALETANAVKALSEAAATTAAQTSTTSETTEPESDSAATTRPSRRRSKMVEG